MSRPVTLCTGQWADLPLTQLVELAADMGFDGLELACWGDHFEVDRALDDPAYCAAHRQLLAKHGLNVWAISNHIVGQAVLDRIDSRHRSIQADAIWGDGDPAGINARAAAALANSARAAQRLGVSVVNGFTGSSIWALLYSFPPVPNEMLDDGFRLLAERFHPILDVFAQCGVKFALEVHPTEIGFDVYSARRVLESLDNRPEFGFNFDPSHLVWQGVDPVAFIEEFGNRIYHVHMKDAAVRLKGRAGVLGSHLNFGDARRGWDFRSLGRGDVNFEEIVRALNQAGYQGPLSVEWEDSGMDRLHGAREALAFVRRLDFPASARAFDAAFDKKEQGAAG